MHPSYKWTLGEVIPSTKIQPVMYLSKCLSNAETRYGPLELEVACLVWAAKKLCTVVQLNNHPVVVLTDYSVTKGIVNRTILQTTATDRANKQLITASIYLSEYGFQVYYLLGRLNYVPNALSRFRTVNDIINSEGKLQRTDDKATLDTVWHTKTSEVIIDHGMAERFKEAYLRDPKYANIIKAMRPVDNAVVDTFSKPGYPFDVAKGLVYNTHDGNRCLCIPHGIIKEILRIAHNENHHFSIRRIMNFLEPYAIYRKSYLVKKYLKHCPSCGVNRTDKQLPVGDLRPIRLEEPLPIKIIAINFILALPKVKTKGTP
jgi:hypothetical protein